MAKKKKHSKSKKKETKSLKMMKSYSTVMLLVIIVLAATLLFVVVLPKAVSKDSMAIYVKPIACDNCNDEAIGQLVKLTGRNLMTYEAEFVSVPMLLIAKDGKLNLVSAQTEAKAKEGLCQLFEGKVCN